MTEPKIAMAPASHVVLPAHHGEHGNRLFFDRQQNEVEKADMKLTAKSMRVLEADPLLSRSDIAHIGIRVSDSVATLTGHVAQAGNQARAEAIVRALPGVTKVVNHLVVDGELMITVAQALGHDPQTEQEALQVNVQHGVVHLGGFMKRAAVRTRAAQVAASIPQVRGVINGIQTVESVVNTDEERFVQPLVGSPIYATDGQVGHVQQVVIDPQTRRVTAVVVHAQLAVPQDLNWAHLPTARLQPQDDILVPIHNIRCPPSGALFLNVNSGEAGHFIHFNPLHFAPPAPNWQPPYPYVSTDILFSGYRSEKES